jgi:hypothetical protein
MANEEGMSVSVRSPPTGESTAHEAIDLPPAVALILTNYFSVRDSKIVSLAVIFNQPSPY